MSPSEAGACAAARVRQLAGTRRRKGPRPAEAGGSRRSSRSEKHGRIERASTRCRPEALERRPARTALAASSWRSGSSARTTRSCCLPSGPGRQFAAEPGRTGRAARLWSGPPAPRSSWPISKLPVTVEIETETHNRVTRPRSKGKIKPPLARRIATRPRSACRRRLPRDIRAATLQALPHPAPFRQHRRRLRHFLAPASCLAQFGNFAYKMLQCHPKLIE